ncbi:MAG TPA: hypothetical protein VF169_00350 [Albitalea sp.]|uniref:hypothetical protein n=1 Tax=Piscinibacter sp. TaxID=1903157 RepID=UPI002ED34FE6
MKVTQSVFVLSQAVACLVAAGATPVANDLPALPPVPIPVPKPPPPPPPPPAPAPAPALQLQLTSPVGGTLLPFTVGQALQQGQVPAGSTVAADIANFQCVVKNRWRDGSAKFAILSGRSDLSPNASKMVALRVAAAPAATTPVSTADLAATGVTASIQFGSFGTAVWNAGDWGSPVQTSVAGPEMAAFTYRKPLGSDAHLVAWLEVRTYKGGRVEVLPWIENGYLRVANPTSKSGTASFTLGGTSRFSQSLTLLNHQRAVLASGSTLTHWFGGDPQVTPRHATAYLMGTRLVPNYRGVTSPNSNLFGRLATSYTPLAQANYESDMGATGYAAGIGLLPEWDVAYLTSGGDPRALRAVVINAYAAGRYGIHYRDETTNRPLLLSGYPHLVMGSGSGVVAIGSSSTGSYTPAASGGSPPVYDSPHHPAMGYMAYLLTGWNYFLEETQLLATANFLKQSDTVRQGGKGIFESAAGTNIPRGAAWGIRTLAQAATLTPDADGLRNAFASSLDENVAYYHGRYVAMPNNPLGLVQPYDHMIDASPSSPWQAHIWQDDFVTGTFGYLKELQVTSASVAAKFDQFLAWKYRAIVGRLGGSGNDQYSYRYAAQYLVYFAPRNSADYSGGTGPWYANWGQVARAMGIGTSGNTGEPLESGYPTEPTSYWGNLMPALSYAVDHGAAGAIEAWNRVTSASNFPTQAAGYDDYPVWGVKPRSLGGGSAPPPRAELNWTASSSSDETGYRVYVGTSGFSNEASKQVP